MPDRFRALFVAACLLTCVRASPAAADPTFGALLDRAKAQADAGHEWGPPGDNVADTFLAMSRMLSTATPEQLAAFEALLHKEQDALARQPEPPPRPAKPPVQAALPEPKAAGAAEPPAPVAVPPAPAPPRAAEPAPAAAVLPAAPPSVAASALFARGQQAETLGDISGARRFYTTAAQQGHADAARALARLYDADYLRQHTVGGIEANAERARFWNEKANELSGGRTALIPEARLAR